MRTNRLSEGLIALSLGSLLLIGAGCGATTQTNVNAQGTAPSGGATTRDRAGEPDYRPDDGGIKANVNGDMKLNYEGSGLKDARREVEAAPPIDEAGSREIKVSATDFSFEPKQIKAKVGEKIKLTLTNSDGKHGIAIPAFNVSLKPGEGETGSTVFIADKAGTYPFFCNVFCGSGHRQMRGELLVE